MHRPYSRGYFLADDALPKDEIDNLFEQLEPVKPPPFLIQHILTSVSRLHPSASPAKQEDEGGELDALDSLVIRKDKLPPN